jgi:hypothetical protein
VPEVERVVIDIVGATRAQQMREDLEAVRDAALSLET